MPKEQILNTAKELFLKHGVKTIGMDDIANSLHISKKTIYQYFSSKEELVKITLEHIYNLVFGKISEIIGKCETPIHEHFEIQKSINNTLGIEMKESTCMFQMKKYYPELKLELDRKRYFDNKKIIKQNLYEGIKRGLYRENLDSDFISTHFFVGIQAFQIDEEFSENFMENFSKKEFNRNFLDYHLRAIVTPKGLEILENILKNEYED